MKLLPIATVLTLGLSAPAWSAEIYKSVDAAGRVTYSTSPLTDATATTYTLALPPGPTPEEVRDAEERYERIAALAAEMEAARRAREEAQARREAEWRYAGPTPVYVLVPFPVLTDVAHPLRPAIGRPGHRSFKKGLIKSSVRASTRSARTRDLNLKRASRSGP